MEEIRLSPKMLFWVIWRQNETGGRCCGNNVMGLLPAYRSRIDCQGVLTSLLLKHPEFENYGLVSERFTLEDLQRGIAGDWHSVALMIPQKKIRIVIPLKENGRPKTPGSSIGDFPILPDDARVFQRAIGGTLVAVKNSHDHKPDSKKDEELAGTRFYGFKPIKRKIQYELKGKVPCFVCGKVPDPNRLTDYFIASAKSEDGGDEGRQISKLFGDRVECDFQNHVPQIKVSACEDHESNLRILLDEVRCRKYGGEISQEIILKALQNGLLAASAA